MGSILELKTPLDRLLDELILEARIWGMSEQLEQYYDTSTIERIRKEITTQHIAEDTTSEA